MRPARADLSLNRRPLRVADFVLLEATQAWLHALRRGARPLLLQEQFPRITNEIQRLRQSPDELNEYFLEKQLDHCGDRQGFHPLIAEELVAINVFHMVRQRRAGRS